MQSNKAVILICYITIGEVFHSVPEDPSYPSGDDLTSVSPSSSYHTAASSFGDSSPAMPVIQTGETGADIGQQAPAAGIDTLACVPPAILSGLTHLDLSHSVIFNEKKVVAGGSYGDICTGSCTILGRGKIKVAIKRLRFWCRDDIETLFTREIYVWSKLSHRNILPLLGYAIDKSTEFPMLISEWMENGSAWNFVTRHLDCDIMHLLVGTACGLNYLHSLGVIHSDIKSDNIMISKAGDALICDFGCARMVDASRSFANLTSGVNGTSRYLAYELLVPLDSNDELPTIHSMKTDVWAFGMTMNFALSDALMRTSGKHKLHTSSENVNYRSSRRQVHLTSREKRMEKLKGFVSAAGTMNPQRGLQ
ncbi:kinase-like protein [Sanghuangporus baumii]|uniref:Kinase-like protein n=1 Tax=Sanghuangporus baumii TaxID=108892 RepID=A0A9Q5I4R9_SANBA|nr:kinase-like protein [Sanghuangporus baumii]